MQKLRDRRGQTLVESLLALLVVTLVMLFLATAIAVAARLNRAVHETDVSFRYSDAEPAGTQTLTVEPENVTAEAFSVDVEVYTRNGYRFYTKTP